MYVAEMLLYVKRKEKNKCFCATIFKNICVHDISVTHFKTLSLKGFCKCVMPASVQLSSTSDLPYCFNMLVVYKKMYKNTKSFTEF